MISVFMSVNEPTEYIYVNKYVLSLTRSSTRPNIEEGRLYYETLLINK